MLSFRYHGTNCFFLKSTMEDRLLALDAGWPGTLYEYARNMKGIGCRLEQVAWCIVTHFHMDHAGLLGEFVERGIQCVVFRNQPAAIDAMEKTIEKNPVDYRRIDKTRLRRIDVAESRAFLQDIGIRGEAIVTDYHSPDSITLITDGSQAFVGDLPPAAHMLPDDARFWADMDKLRSHGVKSIFPSHAPEYGIGQIHWPPQPGRA